MQMKVRGYVGAGALRSPRRGGRWSGSAPYSRGPVPQRTARHAATTHSRCYRGPQAGPPAPGTVPARPPAPLHAVPTHPQRRSVSMGTHTGLSATLIEIAEKMYVSVCVSRCASCTPPHTFSLSLSLCAPSWSGRPWIGRVAAVPCPAGTGAACVPAPPHDAGRAHDHHTTRPTYILPIGVRERVCVCLCVSVCVCVCMGVYGWKPTQTHVRLCVQLQGPPSHVPVLRGFHSTMSPTTPSWPRHRLAPRSYPHAHTHTHTHTQTDRQTDRQTGML
jgi:hypothetical protein